MKEGSNFEPYLKEKVVLSIYSMPQRVEDYIDYIFLIVIQQEFYGIFHFLLLLCNGTLLGYSDFARMVWLILA